MIIVNWIANLHVIGSGHDSRYGGWEGCLGVERKPSWPPRESKNFAPPSLNRLSKAQFSAMCDGVIDFGEAAPLGCSKTVDVGLSRRMLRDRCAAAPTGRMAGIDKGPLAEMLEGIEWR
jgi:hypothetical protein